VTFTLVFALGVSLASAGDSHPDRRPTEGVVLATSRLGLESGSGQAAFNFARLRDLWVRVTLGGATNPAQLRTNPIQLNLRLIDPQGMLIFDSRVAYAPDPSVPTMEVPGARPPVAIFQATPLKDGLLALDYALPVSGSVISRSLSEGTWMLVAEAGGRTFSASIEVRTGY